MSTIGRFLLYAGTHKTGSSAIHQALDESRDAMFEQGLYYPPGPLGITNHSAFVRLCTRGKKPILSPVHRRYFSDWETKLRGISRIRADSKILRDQEPSTVLLGAEQFSALRESKFKCLMRFLRPYWLNREPGGLVYVREPVALFASLALQRLKGSGGFSHLQLDPLTGAVRFVGLFERYFQVRPEVLLYDTARFPSGNIVADFMSRLPLTADLQADKSEIRANPTISPEAGAVMGLLRMESGTNQRSKSGATRFHRIRYCVRQAELMVSEDRPKPVLKEEAALATQFASRDSVRALEELGIPFRTPKFSGRSLTKAQDALTRLRSGINDPNPLVATETLFDLDLAYLRDVEQKARELLLSSLRNTAMGEW